MSAAIPPAVAFREKVRATIYEELRRRAAPAAKAKRRPVAKTLDIMTWHAGCITTLVSEAVDDALREAELEVES